MKFILICVIYFISISLKGQELNPFNDSINKIGEWVSYYKNGQLESKGIYNNGIKEGEWIWYYDNGQLQIKGFYKNGKQVGEWISYYYNGQIQLKGFYKHNN